MLDIEYIVFNAMREHPELTIPISECIDGQLYLINARNSDLGIWNVKDKSFIISRHKFGQNFIDNEYHWDTGAPYGTAIPLKRIRKAPKTREDEKLLVWLNKQAAKYDTKSMALSLARARGLIPNRGQVDE